MGLRRFKFSFLVLCVLFSLSVGNKFRGKLTFPFSKFTINHKDFNALKLKFTCKDMNLRMKECVELCYFRERIGVSCVGFIVNKDTEECNICSPATVSEITNSNNTQINENHAVYVLKYKKKKPVIYLSLDSDNITGRSVVGEGVTGTLHTIEHTRIEAGKVNQGLHIKNGGRLVLDNTVNKCLGNLSICTDGLSIALWINPSSESGFTRHITFSEYSINIVTISSGVIGVWTSGQPNSLSGFATQSVAPLGIWTHVAVIFDPDVGMSVYMNGIQEAFKSIDEAISSPFGVPYDYIFGSKGGGHHAFDGTLDEIKVLYNSLTSTDIWREYTNYHTSLKEEETFNVMVEKVPQNMEIMAVHSDSVFRKDEIALTTVEEDGCGNRENPIGLFAHDHKITEGCKTYRGHTGALWSGNQSLTSGGCSWWYIP